MEAWKWTALSMSISIIISKLLKLATFESFWTTIWSLQQKKESDNRNHRLSHRSGASKQRCSISKLLYKNSLAFPLRSGLKISNSIVSRLLIRQLSRKIASLRFIHNAENIVFSWAAWCGERHNLAIGLGIEGDKCRIQSAICQCIVYGWKAWKRLIKRIGGRKAAQLIEISSVDHRRNGLSTLWRFRCTLLLSAYLEEIWKNGNNFQSNKSLANGEISQR